jgi:poly-gamma-glutamate synthesis protein (capsule biosynthesis protein)
LGDNVQRSARAACGTGTGIELARSPVSGDDVVLTPTHRQLVPAGARLSLVVDVRHASPGATLELALFGDTKGGSLTTLRTAIPSGDRGADDCRRVRLDAVVPPGVVAVQPFVRLVPPGGVQRGAELGVDDVLLVAWAEDDASGRRYDVVGAAEDVSGLQVRSDRSS